MHIYIDCHIIKLLDSYNDQLFILKFYVYSYVNLKNVENKYVLWLNIKQIFKMLYNIIWAEVTWIKNNPILI